MRSKQNTPLEREEMYVQFVDFRNRSKCREWAWVAPRFWQQDIAPDSGPGKWAKRACAKAA